MSSLPTGYPANPLLAERGVYRDWERERVRWSDTDLIGHANHLAFGAFCETGRAMFFRRALAGIERGGLFVVTQLILNFRAELHWPAEVEIGTGVLSIGRSSCRLGQGLFEGERFVGSSEAVIVLIDAQTRRPVEIPEALRGCLQAYQLG